MFNSLAAFFSPRLILTRTLYRLFDLGRYEPTGLLMSRLESHLSYLRADDDALRDVPRNGRVGPRSFTPFEASMSLSGDELIQACQDRGLYVSYLWTGMSL
jgi:hypothetical protein